MKSAKEVLALGRIKAVEKLCALPDPAPILRELLQHASRREPDAVQVNLIVASVLAQVSSQPAFFDVLNGLVDLLLNRIGIPGEEEDLNTLLNALERIDRRQETLRESGAASATAPTIAKLCRLRAGLEVAPNDIDSAHRLFSRALALYEEAGDAYGVVAVNLEIGLLLWHYANNFAGATEYLIHAAETLEAREPPGQRSELRQALVQQLIEKAHYLHYELREYLLAARLARRAVTLSPDEVIAWKILGNALSFLEKFDGAVEAYRSLAALDPKEEHSARANLAVALLRLNHEEEALKAVTDSLRLRPGQIRPLVLRGQLLARANEPQRAIADLETVLDLLEADRPEDSEDPAEQQHYREHWSMWLAAYHNLIELHQQRGDEQALEAILSRLKATGDDALSAMGYRISGDLARQQGRLAEAQRAYDDALRAFPYDTEARVARALLAAEEGDVDGAVGDLAQLAPRERAPQKAIEGLTKVAEFFPEEPGVPRWLGFSYYELGDFNLAEEQLTYYLEQAPNDVEARKWLGLSLISSDPDKQDPEKDGKRCFRGLEELARATSGGDAEARESLLWVIDRLILKFGFDSFFLAQSKPVLEALPILNKLLGELQTAHFGDRNYPLRSQAFGECIVIGAELGLPCFVAYMHALLADIELLQGHVQSARNHVREAQKLNALVLVPRSSELQQQYEQVNPELGDRVLEVEHVHIYEKAAEALRIVELTAARVQATAGNQGQADEALGERSTLLAHIDGIPATEAAVIAQTLRDAGRTEDALAVLDRAEQHLADSGDDYGQTSLLLTRATVLGSTGHIDEAIALIKKAEPKLDPSRKWVAWLNVAAYADAAGMYSEALEILRQFDIDQIARSDQDRFSYHLLRASALDGDGRTHDAREAATEAIAILESMRQQLRDLELRASWSDQQALVYAIAIRNSIASDDLNGAFDLVEQSRSRLLVDEMAVAGSIDDQGRQMEQQLRNATEQRDLLAKLLHTTGAQGPRADTLARLRELDPGLQLVQLDETGAEQLSQERLTRAQARAETLMARLREQLGDHRLTSAERLFGDIVGYESCRRLLAESGPVALIEFVVQEDVTLAFVMRSDWEKPHLVRILADTNVEEWTRTLIRMMTQPRIEAARLRKLQAPVQALLDIIEQELEAEEMICIVPHGALHQIPFHALRLSAGALIERHPIAYAPSASVLARVLTRHGDDHPFVNRAVVVGNTRGDLPYANQEVYATAQLLGVEAVPRHAATRLRLLDELSSFKQLNILHLACHGYFDREDALSSGILTADEDAQGKPAVLSARDLLEIHLEMNLVALSACESGISEVSKGDELTGLTRALLVGGAQSVLGSLWNVDDLSTSILIHYFYEGWVNKGLSKAQALRAAQRDLMRMTRKERDLIYDRVDLRARGIKRLPSSPVATGSDPNEPIYASPFYWAAFTLVGDWR